MADTKTKGVLVGGGLLAAVSLGAARVCSKVGDDVAIGATKALHLGDEAGGAVIDISRHADDLGAAGRLGEAEPALHRALGTTGHVDDGPLHRTLDAAELATDAADIAADQLGGEED